MGVLQEQPVLLTSADQGPLQERAPQVQSQVTRANVTSRKSLATYSSVSHDAERRRADHSVRTLHAGHIGMRVGGPCPELAAHTNPDKAAQRRRLAGHSACRYARSSTTKAAPTGGLPRSGMGLEGPVRSSHARWRRVQCSVDRMCKDSAAIPRIVQRIRGMITGRYLIES